MATQSKVSRQRLKDKKIIIYKEVQGEPDPDGYGGSTVTYQPVHTGKLWAYVRQLSQQEVFEAMRVSVDEDMLFVVGWDSTIATLRPGSSYLKYKSKCFEITRIDTFEGYKEDLQIYAKLSNVVLPE
jgi:SPP1 family predicted phage head-tail adaptor